MAVHPLYEQARQEGMWGCRIYVDILKTKWKHTRYYCHIPVSVGDIIEVETTNNNTLTCKVLSVESIVKDNPFIHGRAKRKVIRILKSNGDNDMNAKFMIPEIKIAKIKHGMGYDHVALCPKEAEIGDSVVYERNHDKFGKVMSVGTIVDFPEDVGCLPNNWVVQKIEKDGMVELKEKQTAANELFKKMEQRSKQLEGINKFSLLAQADEEMAKLLKQFTEMT